MPNDELFLSPKAPVDMTDVELQEEVDFLNGMLHLNVSASNVLEANRLADQVLRCSSSWEYRRRLVREEADTLNISLSESIPWGVSGETRPIYR